MVNRTRHRLALLLMLLPGLSAPTLLRAQSEDDLARYFVGRMVVVKMDMPATKEGVDVIPGRSPGVDYDEYAQRLKRRAPIEGL